MAQSIIVGKTDLTTIPPTFSEGIVGLDGRSWNNAKLIGTAAGDDVEITATASGYMNTAVITDYSLMNLANDGTAGSTAVSATAYNNAGNILCGRADIDKTKAGNTINLACVNSNGALEVASAATMNFITYDGTLANGQDSDAFDCRGARNVRIYGISTNATFLQLQFATVASPYDWKYIDQLNPLDINGTLSVNKLIGTPPPYIRIANTQAVTHTLNIRVILEK